MQHGLPLAAIPDHKLFPADCLGRDDFGRLVNLVDAHGATPCEAFIESGARRGEVVACRDEESEKCFPAEEELFGWCERQAGGC